MKYSLIFIIIVMCFSSCKNEVLPKPKAMLRLDFEESNYSRYATKDFDFEKNDKATVTLDNGSSMTLDYPAMKGSIYITHKRVNANLERLLTDAQKLSYEHVVKADNISEQPFLNEDDNVYGMFYDVAGNAASQSQFYATDSLHHFVTGSLYFYAKPNYDSIYPAAIYLQKDIRRIMESLQWKN